MIWFTSDQHFGHKNIINLCRRPFSDVRNMQNLLIMNWNEVVAPDDLVFVLGDFTLDPEKNLDVLDQLNGEKILFIGNHDKCWRTRSKAEWWRERYVQAGFESVWDNADKAYWPELAGAVGGDFLVAVNHWPYAGDSHDKGEVDHYADDRLPDEGRWLLHGHVHDLWKQHGRQINVGVDVWNYYPVSIETIAAMIEAGPQDIDLKPKAEHFK